MRDLQLYKQLLDGSFSTEEVLPLLQQAADLSPRHLAPFLGVLEPALTHESSAVRSAAVRLLTGFPGVPSLKALVRALRDESEDVRRTAVEALASLSQEAPARIAHALFHPRVDVRSLALETLSREQSLQFALYLSADDANRDAAIEKLRELKAPLDVEAVLSHLDADYLSREAGVQFLANTQASAFYAAIRDAAGRAKLEQKNILNAARNGAAVPAPLASSEPLFADRLFQLMWPHPVEQSQCDEHQGIEKFWREMQRGSVKLRREIAASIVITGFRMGSWPLDAVRCLVQIWPSSLLFECIPLAVRRLAVEVLFEPRESHTLSDVQVQSIIESDVCTNGDGSIRLRAIGAVLHLTRQAAPYKWLLTIINVQTIVQAFQKSPQESAAFLKHRDVSTKGRGYLIRKICTGAGRSDFSYAALIAVTVSADSLDFLESFTPDESVELFRSLHEISTQPGLALNDNKQRITGTYLASHISQRKEQRFLQVWLAQTAPEQSPLGIEIFSCLARILPDDRFMSAVSSLENNETKKLLLAIGWCPGFPYSLEKRLAAELLSHEDADVASWANERAGALLPSGSAMTASVSTTSKAVSAADRKALASATAGDLDSLVTPFLTHSHTGLCSALAACGAGDTPLPRVACAVLGSNDAMDEIDSQFARFMPAGGSYLEELDELMVSHWEGSTNISLLGNAWLFRWEKHTAQIAERVVADGAANVLQIANSLRSEVLASQLWQAVTHVFVKWRYCARPILEECFTPAFAEQLAACLPGPFGHRAAKILATVHAALPGNAALAQIQPAVEHQLPSFNPQVRALLHEWVDSRGIEGVTHQANSRDASESLLAEIDSSTDLVRLQQWCRDENVQTVEHATLRLLELEGKGERCILAALRETPVAAGYSVLAESASLWCDSSAGSALHQAMDLVVDETQPPRVRFRLGLALLSRDEPAPLVDRQAVIEQVIAAACMEEEDAWLLGDDWRKVCAFVPAATLARRWATSPQPYAYRAALEWLLKPGHQRDAAEVAANQHAIGAFLECGAKRQESLRVRAARWLQQRGDARGFPVLLAECLDEKGEDSSLLVSLPGVYVEAAAQAALMAGKPVFPERRLLHMLEAAGVDELSRDLALQMLLRDGCDRTIRESVVRLASRPHVKSAKLRRVAARFAWGVTVARELTGRLFAVQMIGGDDLGYTRLQQPKIYINPLPMLRDHTHGNDVVEGLILHELGHHMYHADRTGIETFDQATKEKMHGLLNLVSDEHLERNIRAMDGGFGDKIKRLAAYAFQHSGKEVPFYTLLKSLKARTFEVLTATPLRVARSADCVKVDCGGLLFEMEKAGMSFARFFRALRMGLGDRHNDAKVRQGLALFKGKFRHRSMPELLEIARQLRQIFGDETSIAEGFSQDEILCPNEGELDEFAEGISESELQSEIRRITDPRQLEHDPSADDGKNAGNARWINVSPDEDFATINTVSPVAYDPAGQSELAARVRRDAIRLRGWLEQLGISMTRQRRRLRGDRLDVSRVRDLVLRNDPRILVARKPVLKTDLFLGVVIDCSGSMAYEDNMGKAKLFATLIAEACRGMQGVDLRITGFTDSIIYDCGDANRPAVSELEAGGGNNDAAALWHAANVALASRRSARLLVMISDGLPTECSAEALKGLVNRLTNRHKICCAQVAVQPLEEICFPHYVCLAEESQQGAVRRFGEVVTRLVRRALSG